jgi:predicted MFS family arabinose efflux permease
MSEGERGPATAGWLSGAEWLLLLVLAAIQLTHVMDFMIIIPLQAELLGALGISLQDFGVLVSAYGFSASLAGLLAARFVDRFDRKRALLVLYAGFTAGTLLCAVAPDYWLLMLGRAVAGGFGGVAAATLMSAVGDAFPYERRATAVGVVMSSFSLALIVAVPAGLYLAERMGWRAPFAVLAGLSLAVLAAAYLILPPLRGHLTAPSAEGPPGLLRVLVEPNHLRAYAMIAALVFGVFMVGAYVPYYLLANVGVSTSELPLVYLFGGLGTLLPVTLFGRLADRYGKLRVFRILALATLVPILLLTHLPPVTLPVAVAVYVLFTLTTSGRWVPAQAMLTAAAAPRYRGSFMSVMGSVQQMTMGVASLVAGLLLGTPSRAGEGAGLAAGGGPLEPLVGFGLVGLLSAGFTVLSVLLAGLVRPAEGGLAAVDVLPAQAADADTVGEGLPETAS